MKKICILGRTTNNIKNAYSWYVKNCYEGLTLNGCEVLGLNYKVLTLDEIEYELWNFEPEVIINHITFHKKHPLDKEFEMFDMIRSSFGTINIHSLHDARHEPRYKQRLDHVFDLALVGQLENLEKFQRYWKIPCYYMPYASLTLNGMAKPTKDLAYEMPVFTGTTTAHRDRVSYLNRLKSVMPIKIIETKSKEDLKQRTAELSASAECILGLCTGYDIDGYIDCRPFQYLGAGACMIIRKFKGMDKIIPPDLYFPIESYNNPNEIKDIFENHIHKKDTSKIRKKAFNFMQKYHSSEVRMKNLLNLLEGKQNTTKSTIGEFD
jgi:hypothetical protein